MKRNYHALLLMAVLTTPTSVLAVDASCAGGTTSVTSGLVATTPTARFVGGKPVEVNATTGDTLPQVVTDNATGLMWTTCPVGFDLGRLGCYKPTAAVTTFTWDEAIAEAENSTFADFSDWRVPNVKELATIVERKCSNPALNQSVFSGNGTNMSASVWTNTPSDTSTTEPKASVIQMYYGETTGLPITGTAQLRMVRTAP